MSEIPCAAFTQLKTNLGKKYVLNKCLYLLKNVYYNNFNYEKHKVQPRVECVIIK